MKKEIIILASMWIVLLTWILWKIHNAPEGYEDDEGFHYEEKSEKNKNIKYETK